MLSRSVRKRRLFAEMLEPRQLLAAEVEPNNSFATATTLPRNDLAEGVLANVADVDHFSVRLNQGDHFSLDTFNVNAPRFDSTLPPGLEMFDPSGRLIATSFDGRDLEVVAASAGDYIIAIRGSNAFGTFVGDYAMQTQITDATPLTEIEPNGANDPAPVAPLGRAIDGSLSAGDDVDRYGVDLIVGETLVVTYAGLSQSAPATRLFGPAGTLVRDDSRGLGMVFTAATAGRYVVQIDAGNTNGPVTGQYVVILNKFESGAIENEVGGTLAAATPWEFESVGGVEFFDQFAFGLLESTSDIDTFRFEISTFGTRIFDVQLGNNDRVTEAGVTLRLYNQYGQFLSQSVNGRLSTDRPDAFAPGTYFLELRAESPIGLGAYAIDASLSPQFSRQRDVTINYIEYDDDSSYFGNDRVNPYNAPQAIPFINGSFESRFAPFDVRVVDQAPAPGIERVQSGIGDFGDFGAGGLGGGSFGQRSTQGNAMTGAADAPVNNLRDVNFTVNTNNHEFGHAAGLPHARDPQSFLSYVGRTEYLSVGSIFNFEGTDNRRPGVSVNNQRNYLDVTLQAGAQVIAPENGATPLALDRFLGEMTIDHRVSQQLDVDDRPNQVRSADINGDGRDDIVATSSQTGSVTVFLTGTNGQLAAGVTTPLTGGVNWWTEPLAIGDFNNDGRDDVAVATAGRIAVLTGSAAGTLSAPTYINLNSLVVAVVADDLNANGMMDLAAVTNNGRLHVLSGRGDGTFVTAVGFDTVASPYSVDSGDINGDGILDLLVGSSTTATVAIHAGAAGLVYAQTGSVETLGDVISLTVNDFNNDGAADLAVISDQPRLVEVFVSAANGTFVQRQVESLTSDPQDIQSEDIDEDGQIDLLIGGLGVTGSVMLGRPGNAFTRPITIGDNRDEYSVTAADLDGDGNQEIVAANYFSNSITVSREAVDDPSNDKVVIFGALNGAVGGVFDVDRYSFNPGTETRWDIDIDAAEFQMPLDAILTVRSASGAILATSNDAVDRQSGIASVDPYVQLRFADVSLIPAGPITLEVSGFSGSAGNYRLKITPGRAMDTDSPRALAVFPDNRATVDSTNQIVVFLDDLIDLASITPQSFRVTGPGDAVVEGSVRLNPLNASLVWTASAVLTPGTYTLTINGVTDLDGNVLDGEVATGFAFPQISGNGTAGGAFVSTFTVGSVDSVATSIRSTTYTRDPYNRGQFTLNLNDQLSLTSVRNASFVLRGAGVDGLFATPDDTLNALDAIYDPIQMTGNGPLTLYTRGIPDPGNYRIEASVTDTAGFVVTLRETVSVPARPIDAPELTHGPSVTSLSIPAGSLVAAIDPASPSALSFSVTFSGAIDPSTLTPQNLFLRRSDNPSFISATDEVIRDSNGAIQYDPTTFTATMSLAAPLLSGFYVLEVNGEAGGVTDVDGRRLDGEFLSSYIDGNTDPTIWQNIPSGNGIPGGSYRAPFVVSTPRLDLQTNAGSISEFGGRATITVTRLFTDLSAPILVSITSSDTTELITPLTVTIPAGATSVTFTAAGVDDSILDGDQTVSIRAAAPGLASATTTLVVTDFESITMSLVSSEISENGGATDLVLTRSDASTAQTITLTSSNTAKAVLPPTVSFPLGVSTVRVRVNAVDNRLVDGTVNVTLSASGLGLIPATTTLLVTDFETLQMTLDVTTISEANGTATATLTRTDPRGALNVNLSSSPSRQISFPLQVRFLDGQATSIPFTITGIDNQIVDGARTIELTAIAAGYQPLVTPIEVTDAEILQFQFDPIAISEFNGSTSLRLLRTDPRGTLTATVTPTVPGVVNAVTVASFVDGELLSQPITVTAIDDNLLTGTRRLTMTAAAAGYLDGIGSFDILDHEPISLTWLAADGSLLSDNRANESVGSVRLRVSLPAPVQLPVPGQVSAGGPVRVSLTPSIGGTTSLPPEITIPVGRQFVDVTVGIVDNDIVDGNRVVSVDATAAAFVAGTAALTIVNDDLPTLSIRYINDPNVANPVLGRLPENGGTAMLELRRNTIPSVSVNATTSPRDQLGLPTEQLRFALGQRTLLVPITALDNVLADGNRVIQVSMNATGHPEVTTDVTIIDDEQPAIVMTDSAGNLQTPTIIAREGASADNLQAQTFGVRLAAAPLTPVQLRVLPASKLQASTSVLRFTRENWNITQSVAITANEDELVAPNESLAVQIAVVDEDSNDAFDNVPSQTIPVTFISNDRAAVIMTETDNGTFANELGMTDEFSVRLDKQPTAPVVVSFDNREISSIVMTPSRLVFTPENWNLDQTVVVSTTLDFDADGNDIGLVYLDVLPGNAFGYDQIGRRRLPLIHVDAELNDLRVRQIGENTALVDTVSGATLRQTPNGTTIMQTGSRDETVTIDASTSTQRIQLNTADGNDTMIVVGSVVATLDGGLGEDTLRLRAPGMMLGQTPISTQSVTGAVTSTPAAILPRNIEQIDAIGFETQRIQLDPDSVRALTDSRNQLFVRSDDEDELLLGSSWQIQMPSTIDGVPYHTLTSGDVTLRLSSTAVFRNPINSADVDVSGEVTALDALLIINFLNKVPGGTLPTTFDQSLIVNGQLRYFDVTGDGVVTALDALRTINTINAVASQARNTFVSSPSTLAPGRPTIPVNGEFVQVATLGQESDAISAIIAEPLVSGGSLVVSPIQSRSLVAVALPVDDAFHDEDDEWWNDNDAWQLLNVAT